MNDQAALSVKKPGAIDTSAEHEPSHTLFGFWVYVMTDLMLFATLFATYLVLRHNTAGGPGANELFDTKTALGETIILLVSSFTCGMALISARSKKIWQTIAWLFITFALGTLFLSIEIHEFATLAAEGNSWQRSGFLSGFFTLVGTHGLHITIGLIWIIVMILQLMAKGLSESVLRRLATFGIFWHFLDVVWIFVFTFVYLMGEIGI